MEKNLEAQLRMNTVVDTLKSTPVRYATFVDKRTKMYFLQRILILPLVVGWDHHPRGSWKWQCSTVSDQSPNESKFSTSTKSLQSLPRDQSHRTSRHPQVKSFYSRKLGRLSNVTFTVLQEGAVMLRLKVLWKLHFWPFHCTIASCCASVAVWRSIRRSIAPGKRQ